MVAVWKTWNDAVPNWGWGSPGKGQGKPARPAPAENFWRPHCFMLEPLVNHFDSWRSFSFLKFILKSLRFKTCRYGSQAPAWGKGDKGSGGGDCSRHCRHDRPEDKWNDSEWSKSNDPERLKRQSAQQCSKILSRCTGKGWDKGYEKGYEKPYVRNL
jgi:hypothetical protein